MRNRRHKCQLEAILNTISQYFALFIFWGYPLDVRLSYGPHYAGCVEVNYAGIWGDVGMFRWDQADGRVVCRQLGYQDVLTVLWRCSIWLVGKSNVVTWIDTVRCTGNESSLTNCTHEWQTYRSSFGFDAGVVCQNRSQTGTRINNPEICVF